MCNKLDSIISKRTMRYLKRTIKKNNNEILNDKNHIKFLKQSLKYMTNYAISSYNYNNYLVNMITNLAEKYNPTETEQETEKYNPTETEQETEKYNPAETEKYNPTETEQATKFNYGNNMYKDDICINV